MNIELINTLEDRELLTLTHLNTGRYLTPDEITTKCIRKSELDKLTDKQRRGNRKSIIGDDASYVLVLGYGAKVISWNSNGLNIYLSLNSSSMFITHYCKTTELTGGETRLVRIDSDVTSYKDLSGDSADNLFKDESIEHTLKNIFNRGNKEVAEEDNMENNTDFTEIFNGENNFEESFKNDGFAGEFKNDAFAGEFNNNGASVNSFSGEETGLEDSVASSSEVEYLQNANKILAFLTANDVVTSIAAKNKPIKEKYSNKEIFKLSEAGLQDPKAIAYIEYNKKKIDDPKGAGKGPKTEDGKPYRLPSEYKVFEHDLIWKEVAPKVSSVILECTAGGAEALSRFLEDTESVLNGSINFSEFDAENPDGEGKLIDLASFMNYLTLVNGVCYEKKTDAIAIPGLVTLKTGKSVTLGYFPGEESNKQKVIGRDNYLPEKVLVSAPLTAEATPEQVEAIYESTAIYLSKIDSAKLANLSAKSASIVSKDDKGVWTMPKAKNVADLAEIYKVLNPEGKTWHGEDVNEYDKRLTLIAKHISINKEGEEKIQNKKTPQATLPANKKKFVDSILNENHPLYNKFKVVKGLSPKFFTYEQLREFKSSKASTDTGNSKTNRAENKRKEALQKAAQAATEYKFSGSSYKAAFASNKESYVDQITKKAVTKSAFESRKAKIAKSFKL